MPCCCSFEIDYRKLEKCRDIVSKQMIAEGWIRKSGKFDSVMDKKAYKLYYKK